MGLDMYLYATPKGHGPEPYKSDDECADLPWNQWHIDGYRELAYWRKANQVHGWFVREVQGGEDECNPFPVHPEKLAELREVCQTVLDHPERAMELLPPTTGFFFGAYEVDEWYFDDLRETVKQLEAVFGDLSVRGMDLYYRSSW